MQVGAIVTVPQGLKGEDSSSEGHSRIHHSFEGFGRVPAACYEILGETLLQRTLDTLRGCAIKQPTVLFEGPACESVFPSRIPSADKFFSSWEASVKQQLDQGVEILLLIRLGAYLELDFVQLLDFHRQGPGILTQVYDGKGAFEVAVVSADQLRGSTGSYRGRLSALIPYHQRFEFSGYSNRLREPQDFRRLAHDALLRRNSIRPVGEELDPGIWLGKGAIVNPSALVLAPAYIGAHTRIKGSCLINGATNIERDCEVDFGTAVTDSSVLPATYLGIGLNFVHSIVAADRVFRLDRNVEVEISDRNLLGTRRTIRGLAKRIREKRFLNRREARLEGANMNLSWSFDAKVGKEILG